MPKLLTANASPVLTAHDGTHGWRFVGLELGVAPNSKTRVYQLLLIGWGTGPWGTRAPGDQVASRFIVERCYLHGSPDQFVRRAILANGADIRIADSWIDEIHEGGFDSQAILSYDGTGPFLIENNELQASSENIMFGGADPSPPDYFPSDIVIRRNHLFKPLRWNPKDPTYDGRRWVIKPLLELKLARRVLIEGNVLENSWLWPAFVFDSFGGKKSPWLAIQDVTFRSNLILNVICPWQAWSASAPIRRVAILNNLAIGIFDPGAGHAYTRGAIGNFASNKAYPIEDLSIEHNTLLGAIRGTTISGQDMLRLTMRYNIMSYGPVVEGRWIWKDPKKNDPYWAVDRAAPDRDFKRNALVGGPTKFGRVDYDSDEFGVWPSADAAGINADGTLKPTSPLRGSALDRTDIGVDFPALRSALRCVEEPRPLLAPCR
jgi:hypothetical protein